VTVLHNMKTRATNSLSALACGPDSRSGPRTATLALLAALAASALGCASAARGEGFIEATDAGAVAATPQGADGPSPDAGAAVASGVQASVTYPFLIPNTQGAVDYFPTVFAHLLGQTLAWPDVSTSLACFALDNQSGSPVNATVRVDLVGYSTPLEQLVTVGAHSTSKPCVNPTPTLSTLYALASPIPGQVHATVTLEGSEAPLLDEVHAVTITTGETVFEGKETSSGNLPLYRDQAVLSMPKDPAVQALLAPAAQRSAWGTFGAGGYGMHVDSSKNPIPRNPVTTSVVTGGFQFDEAYFTAGESIALNVDAVACGSCASPTIDFYVVSETAFNAFSSSPTDGLPLATIVAPAVGPGRKFTITAPTAGTYYFVFVNSALDTLVRNVTYRRTGTQADTVVDTLQAVYEELQSQGLTYDSVAFSFFDPSSTESVRWPATVLTDRAANCIDGSMLFASVLEALQLEPVVVFVPGHAYIGVRQAPGASTLWPLETTFLGEAPFLSALLQGISEYQDPTVSHLAEVDIKAARLAGVLPIPE
jgi:hypothetical protein